MTKFKVGDRVKTEFGIGKIVEINKELTCQYLVYHDSWDKGHNGHNRHNGKKYSGNHCFWVDKSWIELVEPQITSEIKITNRITNQLEDLRIWLETSGKVLSNPENYKQWFMGIWEKDNPIIEKKEGNDMLESLNLVDLYAYKQKEKIESETKEKIEELKGKNEIINKFNELAEKFKKDCDELYLSQFTEEEKNDILIDKDFDDSDMPLTRDDGYLGNYTINLDFKPSEYYDLMNERNKEINKIKALEEKFQEDCKNLYLSQFTEEEKQQILVTGDCIDDSQLPLRSSQDLSQEYFINEDFKPEGYETIRNEAKNKLNEIDSLMKTVKAHVGIAKTKEEVEEILTRYEILDKKGKLKI